MNELDLALSELGMLSEVVPCKDEYKKELIRGTKTSDQVIDLSSTSDCVTTINNLSISNPVKTRTKVTFNENFVSNIAINDKKTKLVNVERERLQREILEKRFSTNHFCGRQHASSSTNHICYFVSPPRETCCHTRSTSSPGFRSCKVSSSIREYSSRLAHRLTSPYHVAARRHGLNTGRKCDEEGRGTRELVERMGGIQLNLQPNETAGHLCEKIDGLDICEPGTKTDLGG